MREALRCRPNGLRGSLPGRESRPDGRRVLGSSERFTTGSSRLHKEHHVGDKSPKAKEKNKKQDTKGKQVKAAAAQEKARPKEPLLKKS
jgi:hypothetical protein